MRLMSVSPRIQTAFAVLALALTTGLAGCFKDGNKSRFYTYCDHTGCYQCDERGCGPLAGLPPGASCGKNAECAPGCFCGADGKCAEAGFCDSQKDCGSGYVCNTTRHSCEPAQGGGGGGGGGNGGGEVKPVACKTATDCPVTGECVDGTCKLAPVLDNACVFNRQCGPGALCQDGRCQKACQNDSVCGTGRACLGGEPRCVASPPAMGACTLSSQCGAGQTCINNVCLISCSKDAECKALNGNDICVRGLCRADERRVAECRINADCAAGKECTDGLCRDFCFASSDCAKCTDGPVCSGGYCMTEREANPQCRTAAACNGLHCTDGACIK